MLFWKFCLDKKILSFDLHYWDISVKLGPRWEILAILKTFCRKKGCVGEKWKLISKISGINFRKLKNCQKFERIFGESLRFSHNNISYNIFLRISTNNSDFLRVRPSFSKEFLSLKIRSVTKSKQILCAKNGRTALKNVSGVNFTSFEWCSAKNRPLGRLRPVSVGSEPRPQLQLLVNLNKRLVLDKQELLGNPPHQQEDLFLGQTQMPTPKVKYFDINSDILSACQTTMLKSVNFL